MELESGITGSDCVKNSLWKGLEHVARETASSTQCSNRGSGNLNISRQESFRFDTGNYCSPRSISSKEGFFLTCKKIFFQKYLRKQSFDQNYTKDK